jgi:hypothetical protein
MPYRTHDRALKALQGRDRNCETVPGDRPRIGTVGTTRDVFEAELAKALGCQCPLPPMTL